MSYLISGIIVLVDQLVKALIRTNFYHSQSVPVLNNIFHLTYVQNKGAAFGILSGQRWIFIIITIIIVIGIYYYRLSQPKNILLEIAVGLIAGGAVGNFIDRIWLGYVVDYLDFRIWPVFNIADSSLVIGVGLLFIYLWKQEQTTAGCKEN